jgi:hypothetical protein
VAVHEDVFMRLFQQTWKRARSDDAKGDRVKIGLKNGPELYFFESYKNLVEESQDWSEHFPKLWRLRIKDMPNYQDVDLKRYGISVIE